MEKLLRFIKTAVKRSEDDFGEEIEMKPIGNHLSKINRGAVKSVYDLSELELLEHPITKAAINRGLVYRVTPIFRTPAFRQPESFQGPKKTPGVSTGVRVDGERAGNFTGPHGESTTMRRQVNRRARAEVVKQPETGGKASAVLAPGKSVQPQNKHYLHKGAVAGKTAAGVQYSEGAWKAKNKNQWLDFESFSDLSVTYKTNSAVIEDAISLIDRRVGYEVEPQRLSISNRGGS